MQQPQVQAGRRHKRSIFEPTDSLLLLGERVLPTNAETSTQTEQPNTEQSTQTVEELSKLDLLQETSTALKARAFGVHVIKVMMLTQNSILGCPQRAFFSMFFFVLLSPLVIPSRSVSLDDENFRTVVKLRLNHCSTDLAGRFAISVGLVSKIFQKWLITMFVRLRFLVTWPS